MSVRTKKTKLWNNGSDEHVEKFNGKEYRIAAGSFIVLNRSEAVGLRGQYSAKEKRLSLEPVDDGSIAPDPFVCNQCGEEFTGQDQLDAHLAKHKQQVFKDQDLEEAIEKAKKPVELELKEGAERKYYSCPFCAIDTGKASEHGSIAALKNHLSKHKNLTQKGIRDFITKVEQKEG